MSAAAVRLHSLRVLRSLANRNCCIVVVGNKCDLKEAREVTHVEACRFAQENGAATDSLDTHLLLDPPLITIGSLYAHCGYCGRFNLP